MQLTSEFIGGIRLKQKEAIWVAAEELSESGARCPSHTDKATALGHPWELLPDDPKTDQGVPADKYR
jgi:hypothetical protein